MEPRAPARVVFWRRGLPLPVFELTKWYADAVSAAGDWWIGYRARLKCGSFSVSYSSVLDSSGQRHSLGSGGMCCRNGEARWSGLGVEGRWVASTPSLHATVYDGVEWTCFIPRGRARVGAIDGLGYVERLRLTIPPWKLPIRRLRWGRYLSERHSLIWIDCLGDCDRRFVFLDGAPIPEMPAIEFTDTLTIRDGALGSTVLGSIPGLDRIAPLRMFGVHECKWRSRARLGDDAGWAIHEVVTWP
jgi:hypothetical protein